MAETAPRHHGCSDPPFDDPVREMEILVGRYF